MTRRKEELREYRSLANGGNVKFGNNSFGTIKGYGMITNGDFTIRKVAYVQHNLINLSLLEVQVSKSHSTMKVLKLLRRRRRK